MIGSGVSVFTLLAVELLVEESENALDTDFENELDRLLPLEKSEDVREATLVSTSDTEDVISLPILEMKDVADDVVPLVAVVTPLEMADGTDETELAKPLMEDVVADLLLADNVVLFVNKALLVVAV